MMYSYDEIFALPFFFLERRRPVRPVPPAMPHKGGITYFLLS